MGTNAVLLVAGNGILDAPSVDPFLGDYSEFFTSTIKRSDYDTRKRLDFSVRT